MSNMISNYLSLGYYMLSKYRNTIHKEDYYLHERVDHCKRISQIRNACNNSDYMSCSRFLMRNCMYNYIKKNSRIYKKNLNYHE